MGEQTRMLKQKAAKFAAKGQNKRAIREYEKLLERKPDDAWTLHRLAELWARENDKQRAAELFIRAAHGYVSDGFSERAQAVYKQALMVDPLQLEAHLRLADELAGKEFEKDAVKQLLRAAALFEENDLVPQEFEVLRRAVELVPDDLDCHMRLARLYVRQQQTDKAREEFLRTAWDLKKAGRIDEFVMVADRAIRLGEKSLKLHHALAENYLQREEWQNAMTVLELPMRLKSDSLKTLEQAARAYLGLNDLKRSVATYKRLARIAKTRGKQGLADEALDRVRQIGTFMKKSPPADVPPLPQDRSAALPETQPPAADGAQDQPLSEVEYQMSLDDEPYEGEQTAEVSEEFDLSGDWQEETDRNGAMAGVEEERETTMMVAIDDLLAQAGESGAASFEDALSSENDLELGEVLEEVDFYIGQGLLEEALQALNSLPASQSEHPQVQVRRDDIQRLQGVDSDDG